MGYKVPGPLSCTWGAASLGGTKQGMVIETRTSAIAVTDDAHGEEPATYIFGGKAVTVTVLGLDVVALKAAAPYIGGLLNIGTIGSLASALAKPLTITDRGGGTPSWSAALAVPMDPVDILLASTRELILPMTFLIVPDSNGKLFQTVPSYLT